MGVLWKSVFVHKGTKKCNNCTTQYPNVPIPITMTWGCWFEEHQNQMANSNSIRPEDHLRSCNFDVSEALCNINLLLLLFHWSATMFECFDQGIFTTIHSVPLSSVHSNFWGPGLHILQLLDCFLDPPWNLGRFPAIFRDNPTIYFHLKKKMALLVATISWWMQQSIVVSLGTTKLQKVVQTKCKFQTRQIVGCGYWYSDTKNNWIIYMQSFLVCHVDFLLIGMA